MPPLAYSMKLINFFESNRSSCRHIAMEAYPAARCHSCFINLFFIDTVMSAECAVIGGKNYLIPAFLLYADKVAVEGALWVEVKYKGQLTLGVNDNFVRLVYILAKGFLVQCMFPAQEVNHLDIEIIQFAIA